MQDIGRKVQIKKVEIIFNLLRTYFNKNFEL